VACSQAWISYNIAAYASDLRRLWLALRHGLVTINSKEKNHEVPLWLALRHGLVTMDTKAIATMACCGLLSGMD